jgi:hypothetical protein
MDPNALTSCIEIVSRGSNRPHHIQVSGSSQDATGATPTALQSPITISNVRTYWLNGYPTLSGEVCPPAIGFSVKNNTGNEIANAIFSATFKEPGSKTVFGTGTTSFDGNLPAGYSRKVAVTSGTGIGNPYGFCSASYLPKLIVSISVSALGFDDTLLSPDQAVNNNASAMYDVDVHSDAEPPSSLSPPPIR